VAERWYTSRFETYVYQGNTYYKLTDGKYKGYYLSYNKNGYLGAFSWRNVVAWEQQSCCLMVDGTYWLTFEYSNSYVVVDHTKHSGYEEICLNLE